MHDVSGNFFNGANSRKEVAVLRCSVEGLLSIINKHGENVAGPDPINEITISSRLGNTPRFLRFADGGVFETSDNDAIDKLHSLISPHSGLAHRLESSLRYVAIGLVVTIAFVWISLQYGIPALAEYTAFSISPQNNRRIGQGVLELLDRTYVNPSKISEEEQERLRQRFLHFIDSSEGIPIQIEFRDAGKSLGANAFALPSGMIVFTDQLVHLAQQDEELLAVYAHEVGHVERRHAMRHVLQSSALTAVVVVVTGDISSVSSLISAIPVILTESGYSRAFEREADRYAVMQLRQNHISTDHFAAILQRLEKSHRCKKTANEEECQKSRQDDQWMNYLSTHPATEERIRALKQ